MLTRLSMRFCQDLTEAKIVAFPGPLTQFTNLWAQRPTSVKDGIFALVGSGGSQPVG